MQIMQKEHIMILAIPHANYTKGQVHILVFVIPVANYCKRTSKYFVFEFLTHSIAKGAVNIMVFAILDAVAAAATAPAGPLLGSVSRPAGPPSPPPL